MESVNLLQEILEVIKQPSHFFDYQNTSVSDQPSFTAKFLIPNTTDKVAIFFNIVNGIPEYFALEYNTSAYVSVKKNEQEIILDFPITSLIFTNKELAVERFVCTIPKAVLPDSIPLKNDCFFNPLIPEEMKDFIMSLSLNRGDLNEV